MGISYVIVKKLAKKEIKQRILKQDLASISELLTIKLDDPKLSIIDDDEILYNGLLYDILSIETKGDYKIIRCIQDAEEDDEINIISSLVKDLLNEETGDLSLKLKKITSNLLEFTILETERNPFIPNWLTLNSFEKVTTLLNLYLTIPNPPPEFSL